MSELKLCKDCRHYQKAWAHPFGGPYLPESCRAPELTRTSPVTGNQIWIDEKADHAPLQMREAGGCGADAKWFESAPEAVIAIQNAHQDPIKQTGGIMDWLF